MWGHLTCVKTNTPTWAHSSATRTHISGLTHPHYTGGPAWRRAKAPSLLSLVGGPDKSNNLTGKQAVMFGQTYLRKALTLLSLTWHTLLPPLSHRHCQLQSAFFLPQSSCMHLQVSVSPPSFILVHLVFHFAPLSLNLCRYFKLSYKNQSWSAN